MLQPALAQILVLTHRVNSLRLLKTTATLQRILSKLAEQVIAGSVQQTVCPTTCLPP
jgi:hypothetical protein